MPKNLKVLILAVGCIAASATQASEQTSPAAIVEEASAGRSDIQAMDFLSKGQTVFLKEGEGLTLVYLSSCLQETITGGTVTIGARQSIVTGGDVERVNVICDDDKMELG